MTNIIKTVIHKIELKLIDSQEPQFVCPIEIIKVATINDKIFMWFKRIDFFSDSIRGLIKVKIKIINTGKCFDCYDLFYIDTIFINNLAWHVFEERN